jgi:heat shock protein HslJ
MNSLLLSILLISISGLAAASDRSTEVDTPGDKPRVEATERIAVSPGLENTDWQLRQYLGDTGELKPVLGATTIDARFSQGEIGGSAGCNRYFGHYTGGQDNRLTVGPELGSTQMTCSPTVDRQEQRYLALLSQVSAWQREDDSLRLLDKQGQLILMFAAAKPAALEDSAWQATGINNGRGGVVSTASTHLATARFAEGRISGSAGCNQFSASYAIKGDRLTIGRAMTTRKHCAQPDGIMQQEQQYLQALARTHTYTVKPDRLELRDEKGALQISYGVESR